MTIVQLKPRESAYCPQPDEMAPYQDVSVLLPPDFILESGERLRRPELRIRLHGERANPLVVAMGGISSDKRVADADDGRGWWCDIVGADKPVDLNRFCVLGFDFLPNPDETLRTITTLDQARALGYALSSLGFEKAHNIVGASYGGMVALALAAARRDLVESLFVISAADRPHPAATALRGIQRRILTFAVECGKPKEGVALARQLAMTTYRTPEEFAARFDGAPGAGAGDPYDVCNYLIARGNAFDMDAGRYLTLSDSIDRHRVAPSAIRAKTTLVAAKSDQLARPEDMRAFAAAIPGAAALHEIESIYGHDAFLKETTVIGALIKNSLQENFS